MTTKADTSVKWFISGTSGAPVLRGQAGALIEVLDACLVDGFCVRTPDSFTVAGGVATLTFSGGNPYPQHAVIAIASASNANLNDEWRIATADATTITFACPGVSDGTITSASVKLAPAGWEKPFADAGAYKAVYRSKNPLSTRPHLRVLDSNSQWVRVRGYESMSDVDTGVNPFPTFAQFSETMYTWPKSSENNANAKNWVVVADNDFFHYVPTWSSSYDWEDFYCFGNQIPLYSSDLFCAYLAAISSSSQSFPNTTVFYSTSEGAAGSSPRLIEGAYNPYSPFAIQACGSGGTNANTAILTDKPIFYPVFNGLTPSKPDGPRAMIPGFRMTLNHMNLTERKKIIEIDGDAAIVLRTGSSGSAAAPRMRFVAITLTGWR